MEPRLKELPEAIKQMRFTEDITLSEIALSRKESDSDEDFKKKLEKYGLLKNGRFV